MKKLSSKRAKALAIGPRVKAEVWERDEHYCVYCGSPNASPEAHFIPRSQGGLGVAQNVLTLCRRCHDEYDHTEYRDEMRTYFKSYLKHKYPDWDESKLIYRRF